VIARHLDHPSITAARRTLAIEMEGLQALADSLDASFSNAVSILFETRGRVIVTGMGKSGHVACKLAATLASTGTPAQFVHPAEASHGDLGMITGQDAVVALSNSGNTAELTAIIAYTRRFRIPLIAITGRAQSPLAEAADATLLLPAMPEACPLGLAPTTSTTMMLALGDGLAVALLEQRGFSADDFQVFHPGGKLGRGLIRVADIMHEGESVPLVRIDAGMAEAILTMSQKTFGCVGIIDAAGDLIGIVTDGDLRRHMDNDLLTRPVAAVMTPDPKTIRPRALAAEALAIMNTHAISSLFVLGKGRRPQGILRLHDCLEAGIA